jgi:uncharacterized SAM-binding protein YcdF (DUF218 family)
MAVMILTLLKEQCRLSSPLGLVLLLVIGVVWLWRRPASRWPLRYWAAVAFGYWFVMTPVGATLLVGGLSHGLTTVATREEARGADAVVVLGGGVHTASVGGEVAGTLTGTSLLRALEGARVFKLIGARVLIVSGGIPRPDRQFRPESEMLRDVMIKVGVAPSAIVEESQSRTTREQALQIGPVLRAAHVQRFVLVTTPSHMRRSLALFQTAGLDPVPSLAPLRSDGVPPPPWLLPNYDSFALSDEAVYDYAAGVYYWARGWTR